MIKFNKILFCFILFSGCVHPKIKFRKAHLLDPMMDPAKTGGLYDGLLSEPRSFVEKGNIDLGGSLGGSCPTCGG